VWCLHFLGHGVCAGSRINAGCLRKYSWVVTLTRDLFAVAKFLVLFSEQPRWKRRSATRKFHNDRGNVLERLVYTDGVRACAGQRLVLRCCCFLCLVSLEFSSALNLKAAPPLSSLTALSTPYCRRHRYAGSAHHGWLTPIVCLPYALCYAMCIYDWSILLVLNYLKIVIMTERCVQSVSR